ncbi:MAG: hypothetical protein AAF491_00445 [Verrucomicrobiota bacterium]
MAGVEEPALPTITEKGGIVMTDGGNAPFQENHPASARNARCPACGRPALVEGRCTACGYRSPEHRIVATQEGGNVQSAGIPDHLETSERSLAQTQSLDLAGNSWGLTTPSIDPLAPNTPQDIRVAPARTGTRTEISGRIIYLAPPQQEPMDFDPWRWVAIPVWGLVLLIAPMTASLLVWQIAGFLPALLVAFVSIVTLRYLFSNRLLESWHLVSALGGRYIVEPMPVVIARLRLWDNQEVQLRFKGQFSGGGVMEGGRIRAVGNWRRGVFRVREAFCERTGARIAPQQPNAFRFAITGAAVLLLLLLWTLLAGLPWATAQLNGLTDPFSSATEIPAIYEYSP